MRIVVPYTKIIKRVSNALDASGYEWEGADVTKSKFAYWYLVKDLWEAGEDFCLIEHDIVIDPRVTLQGFDVCSHPWCACPYPYDMMEQGYYFGMGAVRFKAEVMARHPDLMQEGLSREWTVLWDSKHKPGHWCRVDAWVKPRLYQLGEQIHPHDMVEHLGKEGLSHDCRPKNARRVPTGNVHQLVK